MPTIEGARAWYRNVDPVHGFDHVLRVLALAERIATALDADLEIVRAAALLHDAEGAHPEDGDDRSQHHYSSASFARQILEQEGWGEERIEAVLHCIRAHRFRGGEEPRTLEAKILFDADKLDVNGAFGAARTIGYAVQAGQPIFAEPSARFLETDQTEPDEPHSAYHEYYFKLRHIQERLYTAPAREIGQRHHAVLVEFFEQLAAEAHSTTHLESSK